MAVLLLFLGFVIGLVGLLCYRQWQPVSQDPVLCEYVLVGTDGAVHDSQQFSRVRPPDVLVRQDGNRRISYHLQGADPHDPSRFIFRVTH